MGLAVAAVAVTATVSAARSDPASPVKAAAALARSFGYHPGCGCETGRSRVVKRNGKLWFALYDRQPTGAVNGRERLRIYTWSGTTWDKVGVARWRGWG